MKQFRNDSELGTWLYRIVFNTALMRLRYERRRRNRSIEDPSPFFEGEAQQPQTIASRPPGPESVLLRNETRAVVRACVAQLPAGYRRVLTLRDLEELDTTETARRLGITRSAVKMRLHRARQALTKLIKGILTDEPHVQPS